MKEWFKHLALGFFSDKIAKQTSKRGLSVLLVTVLLTVAVLLLGLLGGYALTFKANYNNSPQLVSTIQKTFSAEEPGFEISGGVLKSNVRIDTVAHEDDKAKYSDGYDIVVDTRSADTLDDFDAYCESASGKTITYEDYLELDTDLKTLYTFKIRYTGETRVIDDEWISRCTAYLDTRTDTATVDAYAKVKDLKGEKYKTELYALYVNTYYPPLTAYEKDGGAPKTRNFYYHNYGKRDKIVYVFCDSIVGAFETDTGAKHTFYGYFNDMPDGKIGTSAEEITDFIYKSYDGAVSVVVYSGLMSFPMLIPFIALIVIAVSIGLYCFTRLLKLEEIRFVAAIKTEMSFLLFASLITAIFALCMGFAVSHSLLSWISGLALFAVLAVRTAVMLILDVRRAKKQKDDGESKKEIPAPVDPFDDVTAEEEGEKDDGAVPAEEHGTDAQDEDNVPAEEHCDTAPDENEQTLTEGEDIL